LGSVAVAWWSAWQAGTGRYPDVVRLDVGDVIVYPVYGVGRVVARRTKMVLGVEQAIVVVELADGLSVELPLLLAREQLRQPVNETGVLRVQETLREDGALSADGWLKRRKQTQAKLTGGDPLELAEVVRDGARRQQLLATRGANRQLSPGERTVYDKARKFLSEEIGLARGLDPEDADAWIEEQITATGS
jgi:CarD family transcriptional regulator